MNQRFSTERGSSAYQPEEDAIAIHAPLASEFGHNEGTTSEARLDPAFADRQRLMSAFGVNFDGHYYVFQGYRYERLSDAINYARLLGTQPSMGQTVVSTQPSGSKQPSASDRYLMTSLNISFESGRYGFEGYRYDHLADAVNYAHLCRRKSTPAVS